MSSRVAPKDYLPRFMRENEEELIDVLSRIDPVVLCRSLFEYCIISSDMSRQFDSLDHSRLKPQLQIRYLLRLIDRRSENVASIWDSFLDLLAKGTLLSKSLADKLDNLSRRGNMTESCCDSSLADMDNIRITSDNVGIITEILVEVSHKWEQLAISLGLKEHQYASFKKDDVEISLYKTLLCWVLGDSTATINILKKALSSNMVGFYSLAKDLDEKFRAEIHTSQIKQKTMPLLHPESYSVPVIKRIPNNTEVEDGRSALLYVLASPRESVCYQWQKDGQPLANNSIYSGVHEDILVINLARQGTEGEYTCCVSLQDEQTVSNEITLKLIYTQKKKQLLDLYCVQGEVPKDSWPPVGTETYIQLVLLEQQHAASGISGHDKESPRDKRSEQVGKQRYSGGTATDVRYEDIFGEYKSGSLIIIEGRPGSGKTTLVHKLVKDWSDGTILNNARLVFLIILRSLNETNNSSQPIFEYLEKFIEESKDKRESGDGACVVLDGLDEYKPKNKTSVIYRLLNKECLPKAMIIVSSRPNVINTAIKKNLKSVTRVQTFGFNKEQIIKYIQHYPFTAGTSDSNSSGNYSVKLEKYLKNHPNVFDMCCLPVHAAMICYLYEVKNGNIPKTQTKIYEEFTLSIILRHLKRQSNEVELSSLKELSGDYKKNFDTLCKLAFIMSVKDVQVANKNELEVLSQAIDSGDSWCFGLLTVHHTFNCRRDNEYTFLHLTFQEFLVAYYIASLTKEDQLAVINRGNEFSSAVWIFLCGLIDFKANEDLFCEINKHLNRDLLVRLSCAFESQQKIICDKIIRSLDNEFYFPSKISSLDITCVKYTTSNTSEVIIALDLPETDTISLLQNIHEKHFEQLLELELDEEISENKDMMTLGRILELCTQLIKVALTFRSISNAGARCISESFGDKIVSLDLTCISCSEGIQTLLSGLKCRAELELKLTFNQLCQQGISEMAAGLKSNVLTSTCLNKLNISDSEINPTNAAAVRDAVHTCFALETLKIFDNSINSGSTETIISSLSCLRFLLEVDLTYQKINDKGAVYLAAVIQDLPQLKYLKLSHNNIGQEGAAAIIKVLPMLTNLIELDLWDNCIGPMGVVNIATNEVLLNVNELLDIDLSNNYIRPTDAVNITTDEVPLSVNEIQDVELSHDIGPPDTVKLSTQLRSTKLHRIDLSNNDIDSTGAATLAVGVNLFTNLRTIYLSKNTIGDDGAAAIGTELHSLLKLKRLYLSQNNIGPTGACKFARGLKHFPCLTQLDLSNNHIGSDGANAIGAELHYLTKLCYLNLSFNKIELLSVNMKNGLSRISSLEYLDLSGNCIDVNSAIRILQALKCCDIYRADLSRDICNNDLDFPWISVQGIVSEEDESAITALEAAAEHISSLRTLDLGFCNIPVKASEH